MTRRARASGPPSCTSGLPIIPCKTNRTALGGLLILPVATVGHGGDPVTTFRHAREAHAKPGFCPPVPSATRCGKAESRCPTLFPFWSGMAKGTEPPVAAAVSPDPDRLLTAAREARNDAAPFALAAAGILVALALVSRHAHWDLLGHRLWWMAAGRGSLYLPLRNVALRAGPA